MDDTFYGVECRHHYGIWIRPCGEYDDLVAVAYREMRDTHTFLTDDNHTWSVELGKTWNRIVVRKNERSSLFVIKPSWCDDGPGALWFRHEFRAASHDRVNAEVSDFLAHVKRCRDEALKNRGSKAGAKRFSNAMRCAEDYEHEARLAVKRWPQHVGFVAINGHDTDLMQSKTVEG